MQNLIISKLFSSFESLVVDNCFKTYGMPSLSKFLKKIENRTNCQIIFIVKKNLFKENKYIIKKKLKNFNKDIYFINEHFFLGNKNFKIFFLFLNELFKFFFLFYFIKKNKIKNIRIDLSSLIYFYFISKLCKINIHLRLYGSYTLNFQKKKNDLYSYLFNKACKIKFNSVICTKDGNSDTDSVKQIFINSKKFNMPLNGSSLMNYNSRKNYNLNYPLNIIFIGRLNYLKGPLHLVKAVAKLKKIKKNIKIVIIGSGEDEKKILNCIKANKMMKNFQIYKKLDHLKIRNKMINSDILICPSFIGYFSNVVLEATSLGLPVMTCDDKFNIIKNKNFNKLQKKFNFQILKNKDITNQIYSNLKKIIKNPYYLYQMSNLQKDIAKKNFKSWEKVINKELNLENFNEA